MQRFFIGRLILALAFAVLSLLISPIGIKLITGREDLTFRVSLLGLCFAAFLLSARDSDRIDRAVAAANVLCVCNHAAGDLFRCLGDRSHRPASC